MSRNSKRIWPYSNSRSFEVIDLGVNGKPMRDFLLVINCNFSLSATVFEIFRRTTNSKIANPMTNRMVTCLPCKHKFENDIHKWVVCVLRLPMWVWIMKIVIIVSQQSPSRHFGDMLQKCYQHFFIFAAFYVITPLTGVIMYVLCIYYYSIITNTDIKVNH